LYNSLFPKWSEFLLEVYHAYTRSQVLIDDDATGW